MYSPFNEDILKVCDTGVDHQLFFHHGGSLYTVVLALSERSIFPSSIQVIIFFARTNRGCISCSNSSRAALISAFIRDMHLISLVSLFRQWMIGHRRRGRLMILGREAISIGRQNR